MTDSQSIVELPVRDGRLLQIAQFARATISLDIPEMRKRFPREHAKLIQPTIDAWRQSLRPLKLIEPRLNGSESRKVKIAFLPLGAKMRPDMSAEKAEVWASSMVAALSDKAVRCIVQAMGAALHEVFEFPTQLEAYLRDKAESVLSVELMYISRLRQLHEALYGRQQELLPTNAPEAPLTRDEVRDLVRMPNAALRRTLIDLGLACGSINAEMLAEVEADEPAHAPH